MRPFLFILCLTLATTSCKKEEDGNTDPSGNSNPNNYVSPPPASVTVTFDGTTAVLEPDAWDFTSEVLHQFDEGDVNCTLLQSAVVVDTANPAERWTFGFVGTFVDQFGTVPTPFQRASMVYVHGYFGGHFIWQTPTSSYYATPGVVITYTDPDGGVWRSDNTPSASVSMDVTQVYNVSPATGTRGWFKADFGGSLKKDGQSRTLIGTFTGPLVVE
jgi:hypothetical protein